jgi:hypothetical protein
VKPDTSLKWYLRIPAVGQADASFTTICLEEARSDKIYSTGIPGVSNHDVTETYDQYFDDLFFGPLKP